jgi:hypothetical protein
VPVLVGVPVIIGCAVLGSIIGTTHPLRSLSPHAQPGEPIDLRRAAVKPEDGASGTAQEGPSAQPGTPQPATPQPGTPQPETPQPGTQVPRKAVARTAPADLAGASGAAARVDPTAPVTVVAMNTGSDDRPLAPGVDPDVAATQGERSEGAPPEGAMRSPSHRVARAKKLKRMLWRRARAKPPSAQPGTQIGAFISSIFPTK